MALRPKILHCLRPILLALTLLAPACDPGQLRGSGSSAAQKDVDRALADAAAAQNLTATLYYIRTLLSGACLSCPSPTEREIRAVRAEAEASEAGARQSISTAAKLGDQSAQQIIESVRFYRITSKQPSPPPAFGLYIYVLPGRLVDRRILAELARYPCSNLLPPSEGDFPSHSAIMVLPVTSTDVASDVSFDLSLAHELLRSTVYQPDENEIYVVASFLPIKPGDHVHMVMPPILMSSIAPPFVPIWLTRLQAMVERDAIGAPEDLDLRLRSLFFTLGSAGDLIGINHPTDGSANASSCSARPYP